MSTNRGQRITSGTGQLDDGYLPLREAAKWTGVSIRTMRRWLQVGLAGYQGGEGGKVLIRSADIHTFLQAQRVGQTRQSQVQGSQSYTR